MLRGRVYSIYKGKSVNVGIYTSHKTDAEVDYKTFTVLTVSTTFKIEQTKAGRRMLYSLERSLL